MRNKIIQINRNLHNYSIPIMRDWGLGVWDWGKRAMNREKIINLRLVDNISSLYYNDRYGSNRTRN